MESDEMKRMIFLFDFFDEVFWDDFEIKTDLFRLKSLKSFGRKNGGC